jgi:hypothetical protein
MNKEKSMNSVVKISSMMDIVSATIVRCIINKWVISKLFLDIVS